MNNGLTWYDRIAHLVGTAALGLLTVAGATSLPDAAGVVHQPIPGWLMIVASVVAFMTGSTTRPIMSKPTVGEAVQQAKIGVVLLAFLALAVSGCASWGTPPVDTTTIQKAENIALDCTKGAAHDNGRKLIDDVGSDLADVNWKAELVDLAKRFTDDAVDCAVREVFGQAQGNAMATKDPLESTKAARAQVWLEARGRSQ